MVLLQNQEPDKFSYKEKKKETTKPDQCKGNKSKWKIQCNRKEERRNKSIFHQMAYIGKIISMKNSVPYHQVGTLYLPILIEAAASGFAKLKAEGKRGKQAQKNRSRPVKERRSENQRPTRSNPTRPNKPINHRSRIQEQHRRRLTE